MASANKVILLGHLGNNPELAYTQGGTAVCRMSLATKHSYKDKEGNRQDKTSWIKLKAFGRQGELCQQYLAKGRQIYVEGRLETDSYEDKQGIRRTKAEVITNQVVFLGEPREARGEARRGEPPQLEAPQLATPASAAVASDAGGVRYGIAPPASFSEESEPASDEGAGDDEIPF